jgi:hypothetical protein
MIARLQLEGAASGLTSRLNDARTQIGLIRNKIFLVTSMAGQGKTNFVCDLVENQFRLFEIPCLFIPARQLNGFAPGTRLFDYIAHNRYAPDGIKLHDYLALFDQVAHDVQKPLVILIDGINEVTDLSSFNEELKAICSAVCQYDWVKLVITCRSEFFDDRFATILDEPFAAHIHRVNDLRSEMTDLSKARLLNAYLAHFLIKGSLQGQAKAFLENDLLLLRIFCERYEGSDVGYVTDIYKGDLFVDYLRKKIDSFPQQQLAKALPTLFKIAASMLAADDFSKLSVRDLYVGSRVKRRAQDLRQTLAGCLFLSVEIGGVDRPGAGVRLAHQLISGSSMTACHNPACTAQTLKGTVSHFLPVHSHQSYSRSPSPRYQALAGA